jgi:hypothetical protein
MVYWNDEVAEQEIVTRENKFTRSHDMAKLRGFKKG